MVRIFARSELLLDTRSEKMPATLANHQHGKSKVRLGRVWREGSKHYFVEWDVNVMLVSDMAHAFKEGTNTNMTATDTTKNTVDFRRLNQSLRFSSTFKKISHRCPHDDLLFCQNYSC